MDWPRAVFLSLEWAWTIAGVLCLAAAGLLALAPKRLALLDGPAARRGALIGLGLAAPFLLALFKCAQLANRELMTDSAVTAGLAWGLGHGGGLASSIYAGQSILAFHFSFTAALLAPLLWLWENAAVLAVAHGLAIGCVPLGVYLLAREATKLGPLSLALGLLALASPFLQDIAGAFLDSGIYIVPILIWSAYGWRTGRRWSLAPAAVLAWTTREQAPLLLFGLGLYGALEAKNARGRAAAALVCLGALALFALDMALMRHAQGADPIRNHWAQYYPGLGDSPAAALKTVLLKPWRLLGILAYPWPKLIPVARAFFWTGFLPLLSGAALLPLAAVWLPQQMAPSNTFFQTLAGCHGAFVLGPILWCATLGARRLWELVKPGRRHLIVSGLLLLAGTGFLRSSTFGLPAGFLPSAWRETGPKAMAAIPPRASLWSDEFFAPQLAMRAKLKILPQERNRLFETGLFVPDRVLLSLYWAKRSEPEFSRALLALLEKRGFRTVFQEGDLVVLANPATLGKEGAEPEPLSLPR